MAGEIDQQPRVFLSTLTPGPGQRWIAGAMALVSVVAFAVLAPFAKVPLAPFWPFIPIYQSALVINDLITAVLLFGQFGIPRSRPLAALGAGYAFSAFAAVAHMMTFPGLFAPGGLLGAGPQSTAWMYMFWHGGFPLCVISYALLIDRAGVRPLARPGLAIAGCVAGALILVCALTVLATAGHDVLPEIMIGNRYTPALIWVVGTVWAVNFVALFVLWRRKPHSVLDLWMMVVLIAWLFDIALSAVLNAGRFDLGFYAGRVYGLLASSFVLIALLAENGRLYAQLARVLQVERGERRRVQEKTDELNVLAEALEQRVGARTAELDKANADLQAQIGERERAEAMAHAALKRLSGIVDSAMDAVITVDERQNVILFNSTAEALFGWPQAEALGAPLSRFVPDRFRTTHGDHVRRFGETGVTSRRMASQRIVTGMRSNGTEFPIDASISQLTLDGRKYYTVIIRDVTERLRAEEALRRSKENLYEMASVSATAREQEKSRIARELHDELAQSLTALRMDVEWLRKRAVAPEGPAASRLATMETMLERTVAATRRIASDLRPLMLDDLGLVPAAQWLAESFKERHGIACEITVEPPDLELVDPQATAVFRIMQEALANVARHAKASRVDVALACVDGQVRLRVSDDGCGFDLANPRKPNSFGLVGLRERVHLVDGEIAIDTAPGRGTIIDVRIPLSPRG